jgi:polysaccharide pyruvyl transferase WcaK-like protein
MLKEGINKSNKLLIGMSVSKIIARYGFLDLKDNEERYKGYIDIMSKVVEYLIKNLNATVIFVPHVIGPWSNDDRTVADDIINLVKDKHKCISIKGEYTTEEVKGIIGECDMFIGARMHATIASTSMFVPTIAIAYSSKTHGIIREMLGQERYVLDIKNLDYNTLIPKIDDVWNNKEKIKRDLESKMDKIKERALFNAELVRDLVLEEKR